MQETALRPSSEVFYCPHCHVYSEQDWYELAKGHLSSSGVGCYKGFIDGFLLSCCKECGKSTIWFGDKVIYPSSSTAPFPIEGMPAEVRDIYTEARNLVNGSPRAASALLRLAVQKLFVYLGQPGKNLNSDIKRLTKKGLPRKIQAALTTIRVIGKEAIRPGEIGDKDDLYSALALFDLVNLIVDVMILHPKRVNNVCHKLPKRSKTQRRTVRKATKKKAFDYCTLFYR